MNSTTQNINTPAGIAPLEGTVALVTGGSRGIGAATALRLAADGADIAFTYNTNAAAADEVVDKIKHAGRRVLAIQADSADAEVAASVVDQTVAEFGRLDLLINNAALGYVAPMAETPVADLDRLLAVNVRGVYVTTQAAIDRLPDGGRVITIGSCVTDRAPGPGMTLYAMTKSAMVGLTQALARELGPRQITANLVHPGPTDTAMNPAGGPSADFQRSQTALGRYGTADEVAGAVSYLAGPSSRYVTGAVLSVDGGHAA